MASFILSLINFKVGVINNKTRPINCLGPHKPCQSHFERICSVYLAFVGTWPSPRGVPKQENTAFPKGLVGFPATVFYLKTELSSAQ